MRKAEAERKWIQRLERAGGMFEAVDSGGGCKRMPGAEVETIRIRTACGDRDGALVVVKARIDGELWVGFVGGPDVVTALLTWYKKEQGTGLSFREDRPYNP